MCQEQNCVHFREVNIGQKLGLVTNESPPALLTLSMIIQYVAFPAAKKLSSIRWRTTVTAKELNLTTKIKTSWQKGKKTRGKISLMLREHFNCYFCGVEVILFAVSLFLLAVRFFSP